ncbi:response regulator [Scytonema millei]|uniref:histidine kinase n=1 Tax=Scytonema millei VB511283 TaxID=1245923 RepID=A0A9X5E820_9CYAN|nr:response regulator [Scytonema millei]NHC36967.1 response regulator [Scytonema millei VB511283]
MKILVVEDDELVAHALTAVLTNQNYAVEVAIDGLAAWDLVQAFDYDLIVLDVVIPKLDGISLCRQIRSKGLSTPILLLTGRDSSHDKAIGLDAGADDYLIKPFDEEELVARLRALLRRSGLVSQPVLKWGNLQLDPSSCEATYNQKHLSLTPKEYALLELFLRNSRRVFSCGTILEHLWSYEDIPSEEAVRTHIKGLRQKLKAAGANSDLLETVYGIGYRLKPLENKGAGSREQGAGGRRELGEKKQPSSRSVAPASTVNQQLTTPNLTSEQQTLSAVAGIWHKFKPRVAEQIGVLEQASAAVSTNNTLSSELLESARKEAHTLAGSLGTFGLAQGSKLAKEIEQMLKGDRAVLQSEATNFCQLVLALRQEIEQKGEVGKPQADSEQPLLLIVDRNGSIAQQLTAAAPDRGFRVAIANNLDTARNKLYQEHPSIVLLDPDLCPRHEESLSLLAELKQRQPPVPVLVLTEQTDLSHRLQIARSGGCTFLQKPMPVAQVLEAIAQSLENAPHAEAHLLVVDDDPKILAVLPALLKPWGMKVTTLDDPRRFWETLEATAPDLLILDVEMPYVNGIDLCQVVRNEPRWSELPILFLTVHHDADIVDRVFSAGADDFVSKPIVGSELVTRIVNRLERMKLLHRINQVRATKNVESENRFQPNEQLQSELNDRQRTQEALQNSQALFAGIVEIADDAIISIDSNQRITLFNSGAERIFGYSAAEAIGQPLDLLLPKRFAIAHRQHVTEFGQSPNLARRMGERREIYGYRKDGTEFPAEASISKLNLGGETVYTVYLHDVSDRKQIERMKDEFISVVSHELRTPLTSIHGSLGMLASGLLQPDSPQGQRLLQIATDSTERLVRLINDILDIERIESGKVKMEKESCDVTELITQAVNVMQPLADKAGITLSVSSLPIQVWADPDRIVQTLTNLLSNAIKFSPTGSTVWLSVEAGSREQGAGSRGKRAGGAEGAILGTSHQSLVTDNRQLLTNNQLPTTNVIFQIKDTGRGIPADKLDSIFERFQQVDSTDSRKHDGTGLGLAICRSIVQQHEGQIWVESVLGEGSTFYFTLPVLQAKSSIEADDLTNSLLLAAQSQLLQVATQHGGSSSPLVLICDDDPDVGAELQTLLENQGYRTVVVHSGQEAIASAATLHPDAILLDLLMPKMNGWEVMAKLKERSDTKDIPIVICSICAPSQSSLSQNSSAWVSKPVDENSLFDSLKLALAKNARPVRVLLVEDDAELADLLLALLKSHNIETFLAKNGREAIRLSQEIKPDLLILDLILPQVDGFGVVEWLHQHDRLYSIPLVVYSAQDLDQSERNRLKLGHTEFLTKGRVSPQEFEQRVLELIGQMTQSKPHNANNDQ